MHQPWRTLEAIINKCLSGKTTSNDKLRKSRIDILYDMFYRENVDYLKLIWEDQAFQIDHIKEKKSRHTQVVNVIVSEEFDPEPTRKKTSSKRRVKKKVTLFADDNIISDDPDAALERIKLSKVTSDPHKKIKSVLSLTPEEQEAADIMKALKESRKSKKRKPGTRGLSEGIGTIPEVLDESTVAQVKELVLNQGFSMRKRTYLKRKLFLNRDLKKKVNTQKKTNLMKRMMIKMDEMYKYKIYVRNYEDEEMLNAKVAESEKGGEEVFDAAKADANKTLDVKDDAKKAEFPPISSSVSVSLEINSLLEVKIQSEVPHIKSPSVLKVPVSVIFEPSVLTPVQESPSAALTTLPPLSVSTKPPVRQQTTTPNPTLPITTDALTITTAILKSDALSAVQLRVAKLEKDMFELKKHLPELTKKQILTVNLEQESEKSPSEILNTKKEQAESKRFQSLLSSLLIRQLSKTLIEDKNAMDKGVVDTIQDHKRKHDDDDDEDDDDKDPPARPNQGKKTIKRRTKESKSSKKPSSTKETLKGKAPSKGFKTGKSASTKELVKEPIAEVVINDICDDVVRDDDQPQDASEPKIAKTPNPEWFRQPSRPPTPDPEWNKRPPGHQNVAIDYFFDNDLEYLKTSDLEVTYTTSITKIKADRYEIKEKEDMVPTLWSTIKHTYDKDVENGIKH
nr:hypothetical protein [Tanacetum cinerariifolium]